MVFKSISDRILAAGRRPEPSRAASRPSTSSRGTSRSGKAAGRSRRDGSVPHLHAARLRRSICCAQEVLKAGRPHLSTHASHPHGVFPMAAALNAFMKIGGAEGESKQAGPTRRGDGSSSRRGIGRSKRKPAGPRAEAPPSASRAPGKMNWEHVFDRSSNTILSYICTGQVLFEEVTLEMCKSTGNTEKRGRLSSRSRWQRPSSPK